MASKRRGHGEGSIYQRKDGRWCASFKTESGKRVYLYGKTRKEVVERLREAQQEHKQGILATGPHIKLGTYLSHWLETVYKSSVKLGSYANTQLTVRNHLQPG
ncbi:hypothetical protein EI42_06417 [Thermosporothrix hazakensis]|jgi:predicted RNase H-like HicB family nuclease|uniref:Integrase-like protein n=1 Tax=Thermosporothrix hazakensis TaxID=644383 RepID=A0A326TR39_THEHA|nr:hypothetical protein [Thermosporothrix hazakensis]PZW18010.1 hypothetical protein EI42_06417 [Thermosporothrix hazakensis]GCE50478.1 hypothetical protein KTH_53470 [Thermosporothrix hazakensis]